MKLIIRAVVTTCIAGVIFLTIMAVSGRMNRSMELKSNLPSAAEETAKNLLTKKYNVTDKNQLEADFLETLAYAIDSDSDIQLKVNAADTDKQLLSVSVTEEFNYYLSDADTGYYKCYTVLKDDVIPIPKDPVMEGKTFTGWTDADGNTLDPDMTITQNTDCYAKWN